MKERVTIWMEPEAIEAARAEVESGKAPDLSSLVEEALLARQRSEALREYLELWEEEHGPISEEAEEWGRRELARAFREASSSTLER